MSHVLDFAKEEMPQKPDILLRMSYMWYISQKHLLTTG